MSYELVRSSSPNPLIPWIYVFRSLSLARFQEVYDKLNFPVVPSENLRQLSKDFVIAYETNLGGVVSETASIDLLEGISPSDDYKKRRETLFNNMFLQLEQMGHAEAIYKWVRHTADYYKYRDVFQASVWCILLLKWAILEQVKQPIPKDHDLYSDDWSDLVAKCTPIYTRIPRPPFKQLVIETLPLSEESNLALRALIFQHEAVHLHFQNILEEILIVPEDSWEDSVLRSGGCYMWLKLEGRFRLRVQELNAIVEMLSVNEMDILKTWGIKDSYHKLEIPIPVLLSNWV